MPNKTLIKHLLHVKNTVINENHRLLYILRSSLGDSAYTEVYSAENRKLMKIITSSMPWILYNPNADGVFCFYYRSSLEAQIFLTNSNISPEAEINMICDMLDRLTEVLGDSKMKLDVFQEVFGSDVIRNMRQGSSRVGFDKVDHAG